MIEEYKYVVDNSKYVKIIPENIDKFIEDLGIIKYSHWYNDYDLKLNEKERILLAFIIEAMNYCFWQEPKWKVEYKSELITGSNALFTAVIKEVENNKNFLTLDYLNDLDINNFSKIFAGINTCPFLEKRYNNFKEVINYFVNHDVYKELFNIKSNKELLEYIVTNFSSFNDVSWYKGHLIKFYKRANLLVNDLFNLSLTIKNNIHDVFNLSGCADYGIPRTFRDYKIIEYSDELAYLVDNKKLIEHGSEMEVEIRANILYIIELIKNKIKDKNIIIASVELDNLIWLMGKRMKDRSNSHHTITIYY